MWYKRGMITHQELVRALRAALSRGRLAEITEKPMFGGVCFLAKNHILCGITSRGDFMFRVGKEQNDEALKLPCARPMDFTRKPMPGFLFVDAEVIDRGELDGWIALAHRYVGSLPPKAEKPPKLRQATPAKKSKRATASRVEP